MTRLIGRLSWVAFAGKQRNQWTAHWRFEGLHCTKLQALRRMPALGQTRTLTEIRDMSASTQRADIPNPTLREFDLPVVLCPIDDSPETQCSYRLGDLSVFFLVGRSAPAGMTERNMFDVMSRAFTCSNIPQCDHFPSLKLKASYL